MTSGRVIPSDDSASTIAFASSRAVCSDAVPYTPGGTSPDAVRKSTQSLTLHPWQMTTCRDVTRSDRAHQGRAGCSTRSLQALEEQRDEDGPRRTFVSVGQMHDEGRRRCTAHRGAQLTPMTQVAVCVDCGGRSQPDCAFGRGSRVDRLLRGTKFLLPTTSAVVYQGNSATEVTKSIDEFVECSRR